MLIVEINNLTVQYPDVKALDDVSFIVNSGDFLGIIGPNGAGKSTAMKMLTGFLRPTSGAAFIATGMPVANC